MENEDSNEDSQAGRRRRPRPEVGRLPQRHRQAHPGQEAHLNQDAKPSAGRKPSKSPAATPRAAQRPVRLGRAMADADARLAASADVRRHPAGAIEEVAMTTRGGRRQGPEQYPFGELPPSRIEAARSSARRSSSPTARIRRRSSRPDASGTREGKVFLTRQMEGPSPTNKDEQVPGVRVWLAPPGTTTNKSTRKERRPSSTGGGLFFIRPAFFWLTFASSLSV
jgi:hypothetical protein